MSFLDHIFGEKKDGKNKNNPWQEIHSEEDLQAAVLESYNRKIVIFKHSTRCGVSRMVFKNLVNEIAMNDRGAAYYLLDLLKYRPLSNKISHDFGVLHQSPQMIVMKNGRVMAHASHNEVSTAII